MAKRNIPSLLLVLGALYGTASWAVAQATKPDQSLYRIQRDVDMVQLNVAVTDNKGDYITGLRPRDFAILEDGIPQKIATFEDATESTRKLASLTAAGPLGHDAAPEGLLKGTPDRLDSLTSGASVFILFDTSNYMYRGFVFAQDAIAEFIRSLDHPDRVAFYSYSRDFSRDAPLTSDQSAVLRGVRATVAGDDAALYNSLLLTLKDAARYSGRRVVVVFSNGPDNASMVAPEDVRELAQAEGIPIYMISTREARLDPVSTAVFERMSATTGGKAYFAKNWTEQQQAFASIRDDLAHLYSLSYYPQSNPNHGWRSITVKLVGERFRKDHIRTRSGYRPKLARLAGQINPLPEN